MRKDNNLLAYAKSTCPPVTPRVRTPVPPEVSKAKKALKHLSNTRSQPPVLRIISG